jgi:Domain of unknown function DUF29
MDRPVSYDDDFLAWSEQQAAALRGLAGRRGLPNELDLEHVAEEIEDLGRAEFNTVCQELHPANPSASDQSCVRARGQTCLALAEGDCGIPQRPS